MTPIPLRRSGGNSPVWELPLALRLWARRKDRPIGLIGTGDGPLLALRIESATGRRLAGGRLPPGRLTGLVLPAGAARLRWEDGPPGTDLAIYPFSRPLLWALAVRQGVSPYGPEMRRVRARLKRALLTSPAADLVNGPALRQHAARFLGDFAAVPAVRAAPRLTFLSVADGVTGEALAVVARALSAQTDPAFAWILAASPDDKARLAGHPALASLPATSAVEWVEGAGLAAALAAAAPETLAVPLPLDGTPTRDAVAMIRDAFAAHPDCALAYTDEAFVDAAGTVSAARFKPAFNRHLQIAGDYMGRLTALPASAAQALGLRTELGGAALHDLLLRHIETIAPEQVRHIPRIAWLGPYRETDGFPPAEAARAAEALAHRLGVPVVTAPVDAAGQRRQLRPLYAVPEPPPPVSIIIPTRDRAGLLATTLFTLIERTAYRAFEIVILDNGSREPETFALFEEIRARWPASRVVRDEGDFNFARLCNAGIAAATGERLLLLNNDMEIVEPDWLGEMVALSCLPRTGIVGAKLLYPDRSVQHAGFIVGLREGAGGHWFVGAGSDEPGPGGRLNMRQNLSAVTGACLMITRDCLAATGPLDEARFAEDCNDIDLCLRARQAGYEVVFTPFARLIHHESASRLDDPGGPVSPKRRAEWARFEEMWAPARHVDPAYSPNLRRDNIFALPARRPGDRRPRTDRPGTA